MTTTVGLVDRTDESAALERLVAGVPDGLGGALVVRGGAGVGKTALLEHAVEAAEDLQIARVVGVQSEMELAFAGVHQLLLPFLHRLQRLPAPQAEALSTAFGLVAGPPPNGFLVGLAVLTMVTDAAAEWPVLCLVDDAQWLDRASVEALGFAARRLLADRVGMLFAVREGESRAAVLAGLPEVKVGGLPGEAAHELLAASAAGPVDPRVAERIVAEAAGNPLALVEVTRELGAAELSGTVPLTSPLRFGGRLEELYVSRVRALPAGAQQLLLVAAAEPSGEPGLVWRAAGQLGIDPAVAELPGMERLAVWEAQVRFLHPLMRSAAYYAASSIARRRAHAALAEATDPGRDPDRRAWHLAEAASGPDEEVAAELERSAGRSRARGGWASRAAFLERAAAMSPGADSRARRLLEAAAASMVAGELASAQTLLERAAPGLEQPAARATARRMEGLILHGTGRMAEAASALLDAARMAEPHDTRLARDTLLEALAATEVSGRHATVTAEVLAVARSIRRADGAPPTLADLLLDGFAAMAEHRYADGVPLLRQAIGCVSAGTEPLPDHFLPLLLLLTATVVLHDDAGWQELEERWIPALRARGALTALLIALNFQQTIRGMQGRVTAAEAEAERLSFAAAMGAEAMGGDPGFSRLTALMRQGGEAEAAAIAGRMLRSLAGQGNGIGAHPVHERLTWLELGVGNYEAALRYAREALADVPVPAPWPHADVVEAASRCGDQATARAHAEAFAPLAMACGDALALGLLARCRALLPGGEEQTEAYHREAVERLRRCPDVLQLARTHLLFGEWLRRQRRRREARDQLRAAWQIFDELGMEAFAERARVELAATGERVRKRQAEAREALTPQEAQIARMAAAGAPNREIAAQLFLSVATVDYHLRKVFRKLGITRRVQLVKALDEAGKTPTPPA
jgi:DNA-binding CsgD family transcriptional regulator